MAPIESSESGVVHEAKHGRRLSATPTINVEGTDIKTMEAPLESLGSRAARKTIKALVQIRSDAVSIADLVRQAREHAGHGEHESTNVANTVYDRTRY